MNSLVTFTGTTILIDFSDTMATYIRVNIGSGNSLFPDDT